MIPEIPDLPEVKSAQVSALNTHHYKALPGMPHLRWESILGYNPGEYAAARYAQEMAIAFAITREQNRIMEAKARAKNRIFQREAER